MENSHMAIGLIDRQADQLEAINTLEEAFYKGVASSNVKEATIPNRWAKKALEKIKNLEDLAEFIRDNLFDLDVPKRLTIITEPHFLSRIVESGENSDLNKALSDYLDVQVYVTVVRQSVQSLRDVINEALNN